MLLLLGSGLSDLLGLRKKVQKIDPYSQMSVRRMLRIGRAHIKEALNSKGKAQPTRKSLLDLTLIGKEERFKCHQGNPKPIAP
jgi:hypothetical protein